MLISRREILSGTSAAALMLGMPKQLEASIEGSSGLNNNRVTINAPSAFLNLAKGFSFAIDPTNSSSDGYPIRTPSGALGSNGSMPLKYYGPLVWKFSGQGSMQTGGAMLVASGGANIFELRGADSGAVFGNITILSKTNPRVVFQFGWNIQSISVGASNGSGGNLIRIRLSTNAFDASGVANGIVVNITGANTNVGANSEWAIQRVDAQTFDLQGSTFTLAQASPGGRAVYAAQNLGLAMYPKGTFSNMSNLVVCKLGDEPAVDGGAINDTTLIDQLRYLMNSESRGNPGWIRFMDVIGAQTNFEADFSQRMPVTYITYNALRFPPGYWTNKISWSAGDAYNCSDPSVSVWSGSSYIDNAVVQGFVDLNNIGSTPTLNVGGHGAKPIYNFNITTLSLKLWGNLPSAAGQTISISFQASWLNNGTPVTVNYRTVTADTKSFTGAGGLYANLNVAMAANSTLTNAGISFGNTGPDSLHSATTISCRTPRAGSLTVTYISGPTGLNATVGVLQPLTLSTDPNSGLQYLNTLRTTMAGVIVTGDVLNFTFTRSDLPGGSHAVTYTTDTLGNGPGGAPDSSLQNLVRNLVAQINADGYLQGAGIQVTSSNLPVAATFDVSQGPTLTVAIFTASITGTNMTVSAMRSGTIAIGNYVNNGGAGGGVALYTQVVSQTSGTTGGAGVYVVSKLQTVGSVTTWTGTSNDGNSYDSWTGGGLSLSFTKVSGSGTETATIGSSGNYKASFIYNYLLDGWILRGPNGIIQSQPFEMIAEMCNLVGVNCWFNWGTHKGAFVTAVANFFATNLNSGLKFGTEPGNEVWNFTASGPWGQWGAFGSALNFAPGTNNPNYSFAALRLIQYTALAKAAWTTAGRSLSDFIVHQPNWGADTSVNGGFDTSQLKGTALTTSNGVYAAHGGLGGGSSPSYTATGSRPVDITNSIGVAPYWSNPWFSNQGIAGITGTVAQNAPWLQASLDFTNGSTTTAFTSLANQFNGTTTRSVGATGGPFLGTGSTPGVVYFDAEMAAQEALAASYDTYRVGAGLPKLSIFHYESGPQWGPTPNGAVNIIVLAGNGYAGDIATLANYMLSLSWDVRAYDSSGSTNVNTAATNVATQVLTMIIAWKHDAAYKNLIKTYYYGRLASISGINREVHPAQYGFDGSLDPWGLFPGSYQQGNPFASYTAIQEWNA
jgi:hypothetical protein